MPIATALPAVQPGQADQGSRARPGRVGSHRQGTLHPTCSLDRVTAEEPEPPQAGREPERGPGLVGARPAQRSAQVVVLAVEQLRLFDDHPGGPFGIVGFGDGKEVGAMRSRQLSRLTCMIEILLAKLADRLQLPVSGPGAPPFGDHQRLVHQLGQQVEQFDLLEGRVSADCCHSVEGETTREHRQPAQQNLLRFGEQFVAPFQGATQRLVPCDAAGSPAEHGQSIAQSLDDLGGFEYGRPGRGQFEGQRHPVEPSAQLCHPLRVVGVERETRPDLRCPLNEKPDRGQTAQHGQIESVSRQGRGQGQ
ncbi:hypothetical protein SRABI128_06500 [Microbacterium sp. Bi128]|nr:hypothetical protein SRABI128_06500 [Microbacterium sp. Bi128]